MKVLIFIVSLLITNLVQAKDVDDWNITNYKGFILSKTNGEVINGHFFGFILKKNNCNNPIVINSWSVARSEAMDINYDNALLGFFNEKNHLMLKFPSSKFTLNKKISLYIVSFTNIELPYEITKLITSEERFGIKILGPQKLVSIMDPDLNVEYFSSNGFSESLKYATKLCDEM